MADVSVRQGPDVAGFDFRRPSLLSREDVRAIEGAHEMFVRRLATRWSSRLRALVQVDPLGVDQARYDDYLRSMPTPTVLGIVGLPPLPGAALLEVNSQLALLLVDRMLGGAGAGLSAHPDLARRPTDLEEALVRDLIDQAAAAVAEALDPLADGSEVLGLDYNPQQVQIAAPSDMVVVLTYRVGVSQGVECEGLVSLCYPGVAARPIVEHLANSGRGSTLGDGLDEEVARRAVAERLDQVDVELTVTLGESDVPASDVSRLRVGDVLRLDHQLAHPVEGRVGGSPVLDGHLGRRGRRMALQVTRWRPPPSRPTPVVAERPAYPVADEDEPADSDRSSR